MTTKGFAAMFNMSVNEMCEFTGFSRDGLIEIVKGRSTKNSTKKTEARHDLRDISHLILQNEINEANERFDERYRCISEVFGIIT